MGSQDGSRQSSIGKRDAASAPCWRQGQITGKRQLVLGLLTDETGEPLSVSLFPCNTSDLNTFSTQIETLKINFAREHITLVVGAVKFALKPGQHTVIKPEPEAADQRLCHTALYFPKDDQAKPFFSSKRPLSDRARGLIFVYHDPGTNRLRLHTIRNFP